MRLSSFAAAMAVLTLAPRIATAGYVIATIDDPGAVGTALLGINDNGQIVGFGTGQGGFLYSGNTFTNIGLTYATGINNIGQIVAEDAFEQGYLISGGIRFPLPPGAGVRGINDAGQMVGFFSNGTGGYLLSGLNGTLTTFNLGAGTELTAINNSGQMLATTYAGSYLIDGANVTPINVPGSTLTQAFGINNHGDIVGNYTVNDKGYAFVLSGGIYTTIDSPGPPTSGIIAFGINDFGQVVGEYGGNDGREHGFIATPDGSSPHVTPEPSSIALALTGIPCLWTLIRRRSTFKGRDGVGRCYEGEASGSESPATSDSYCAASP